MYLGLGLRLAARGGLPYDAALFGPSDDGFLHNLSQTSLLAQNSNGTAPVTADNDPIGWAKSPVASQRIATQATTSARPFWKTPNFSRLDGSDDHLQTSWLPTPSFTFAVKAKMPSASATKLIMGASDGTGVAAIGIRATTGLLCASIGLTGTTTINGGNNVSGQIGVAAVSVSGTSVVLYWNGSPIFSGSFTGPIPTTRPVYLGAYNSVGTAALFADCDLYNALAINRALTPAEALNLSNYWNAQ